MKTAAIDDAAARCNVLVAFPYWQDDIGRHVRDNPDTFRLLIDSGAFTAWKAGKTIALDDYCRFLERLPVAPWRYFTLDVVGDPDGTERNYRTMLARGFKPIPIFTRGEDPAQIDRMYETAEVVGIGGLVGTQGNKGFVNGIMRRANGRRVHWLGFTNAEYLRAWRPYMADSSTWQMGSRRRFIPIYMGRGFIRQFKKHEFAPGKLPRRAIEALARYGIAEHETRSEAAWQPNSRLIREVGMCSFLEMSLEARERIGTHVFVACGSASDVSTALRSYQRLRKAHGNAESRPVK